MLVPNNLARVLWTKRSLLSLLAANALTIVLAVVEGWELGPLMWIYWIQSIIIGGFRFLRMLSLDRFSTDGVLINDRPVKPTRATQMKMSFFFLVHYGGFHLAYAFFLVSEQKVAPGDGFLIVVCVAIFLANHWFSFRSNLEKDVRTTPNIGRLMFFPYARIIPMHMTIVFGAYVAATETALLIFLSLKTLADLIMHAIEHRQGSFRKIILPAEAR